MIKLSRNGIAYDLTKTPYVHTVKYEGDTSIVYSFSSELYLNKFKDKLEENRNKINESLSKRFGMVVVNNVLNDLVLYSKTEYRGFYVVINGEEFKCPSTIKLIGVNQTLKN